MWSSAYDVAKASWWQIILSSTGHDYRLALEKEWTATECCPQKSLYVVSSWNCLLIKHCNVALESLIHLRMPLMSFASWWQMHWHQHNPRRLLTIFSDHMRRHMRPEPGPGLSALAVPSGANAHGARESPCLPVSSWPGKCIAKSCQTLVDLREATANPRQWLQPGEIAKCSNSKFH